MVDIGLRLDIKQTQKLLMTPSLQQAIKLLQLSKLDLVQLVRQELTENPLLEEVSQELSADADEEKLSTDEKDPASEASDESSESSEVSESTDHTSEIDWDEYFNDSTDLGLPSFRDYNLDLPSWENTLVKTRTLHDHLLWQLRFIHIPEQEVEIGEVIIGNIDDDGYFQASIEEVAKMTKSSVEETEKVLSLVQSFEPVGVGARDLKECLLLQVKGKGENVLLQAKIIEEHMDKLEHRKYPAIASALKIPLKTVVELTQTIASYDPRPGSRFTASEVRYVVPDVFIYKLGGEFVVIINDEGMPRLRISNFYRKVLRQKGNGSDGSTRKYVEEKMRSAVWLIKSIQQRQMTLYKVAESLVKFQSEFLNEGINKLRPLTLRDVADDISVHESTVSRITTDKYVQTPRGIYELKYFFHSGLEQADGRAVSSVRIKDMIKRLVETEDKHHPLTDAKILKLLAAQRVHIARRTITKYRESLNILPASQRRRF